MTSRQTTSTFILLAAVVLAAVVRGGQSDQVPPSSTTSNRRGAATSPGDARPHDEDAFDALDAIADSLAVNISDEGLKARTRRTLRSLRAERNPEKWKMQLQFVETVLVKGFRTSDSRLAPAIEALAALHKAPPFQDRDTASADEDEKGEMLKFVHCFVLDQIGHGDREDTCADQAPAHAPITIATTELQIEVLKLAVTEQQAPVAFVVGMLPDPIDSFTGWQFDPMLDAMTQAVVASGYVLDRFHFPDSDPEHGETGAATHVSGRAHEDEPSLIVFRHPGSGERLVLFIVHENPTAGVHARALAATIRLIVRCDPLITVEPRVGVRRIRILGPTFSGTAETLRRTLAMVERTISRSGYEVDIISGSATDDTVEQTLENAIPDEVVSYAATVQPDTVLFQVLVPELRRASWSRKMAVLFESNTQYGRQLWGTLSTADRTNSLTGDGDRFELIQLPFPMNVSRLRKTADAERAAAGALGLPSKFRPLVMEGMGRPADQIPQYNPDTTSAYVELALAGALDTMRREGVGTVALMATDPRDKLFLAQQIARHSPDVSIFTAESDSIYVHPDFSGYLRGAIVASTYPLHSANQRWSAGFQGRTERRQFANGSSQGIYNAMLALLHYDRNGEPLHPERGHPRLLEYGTPGGACRRCQPPVWISVIGRHGAWPVRAVDVGFEDRAVSPIFVANLTENRPSADGGVPSASDAVSVTPSPLFNVFVILLVFGSVACAMGLPGVPSALALGERSAAAAPDPRRLNLCLLAALAGPLLWLLVVGVVAVARFRIDTSTRSLALIAGSALGLLAIARVMAPLLRRVHPMRRFGADRVPASPAFQAASALLCGSSLFYLGWYLVASLGDSPGDAIGFVARSLDFGSGLSPVLPIVCLGGILLLWGLCEFARASAAPVALTDASLLPVIQEAIHGDASRLRKGWTLFDSWIVTVPAPYRGIAALTLGATCIFAFDPVARPLVSLEGERFGRFVSAALLLGQVMVTLSLLQFICLWLRMKELLRHLSCYALAAAFERVPHDLFPPRLFATVPRLIELHAPVRQWERLLREPGFTLSRAADVKAALEVGESFDREMKAAAPAAWSASGTWRALVQAGAHAAAFLRAGGVAAAPAAAAFPQLAFTGPASPAGLPPAIGPDANGPSDTGRQARTHAEDLVAMLIALAIRDGLSRLAHNLVFVIGGIILAFCTHTLFPFQQDTRLQLLGWIYVALAFAAILSVLAQMKRNDLLGRIASGGSGRHATWDGEFVLKLAVFGLLPLVTLFAAQFPDLGGLLLRWLAPVKDALP